MKLFEDFIKKVKRNENKDHWIEDEQCGTCNECGRRFSTFLRKHHCRVCGQIFCSKCVSKQVTISNNETPVKVCDFCHEFTTSQQDPKNTVFNQENLENYLNTDNNNKYNISFNRMELLRSARNIDLQANSNVSSTTSLNSRTDSFLRSIPFGESVERDKLYVYDSDAIYDPEIAWVMKNEDNFNTPLYEKSEPEPSIIKQNEHILKLPETIKEESIIPSPDLKKPPTIPYGVAEQKPQYEKQLNDGSIKYIEKLLSQTISDCNIESEDWLKVIMKLTLKAIYNITINPKNSNNMDIKKMVKIKKMLNGSPKQSHFVKGMVFTHTLANKTMRTKLYNVRILILSCDISYPFKKGKHISMAELIAYEGAYIKDLISEIVKLHPKLIVLKGYVCQFAMDILNKTNICVAEGVKESVIFQLAKICGTDVFSSLKGLKEETLGKCELFEVQTHTSTRSYFGTKSYLYFKGCDNRSGCSIVLRDNKFEILKKIKKVLRFSISVAYSLKLETFLMRDLFIKFPSNQGLKGTYKLKDHKFITESSISEENAIITIDPLYCQDSVNEFLDIINSRLLSSSPLVHYPLPYIARTINSERESVHSIQQDYMNKIKNKIVGSLDENVFDKQQYKHYMSKGYTPIVKNIETRLSFLENYWQNYKYSITPISYQNITVLYYKVSTKKNILCESPRHIKYTYYENDTTLGNFLKSNCFDMEHLCKECNCNSSFHLKSFIHDEGSITIEVEKRDCPIKGMESKYLLCTDCKLCFKRTPVIVLSEESQNYSFGKFLELIFYHKILPFRAQLCEHTLFINHVMNFWHKGYVTTFKYKKISLFEIRIPPLKMCISHELYNEIKEKEFQNIKSILNEYWNSIQVKIKSLIIFNRNINSEDSTKMEDCQFILNDMYKRIILEDQYYYQILERLHINTVPTNISSLNSVLLMVQERSTEIDSEFQDIFLKFFPAEKDLKRLTNFYNRKINLDLKEIENFSFTEYNKNYKQQSKPVVYQPNISLLQKENTFLFENDIPVILIDHEKEVPKKGKVFPMLGKSPTENKKYITKDNDADTENLFNKKYITRRKYSLKNMFEDRTIKHSNTLESKSSTTLESQNIQNPKNFDFNFRFLNINDLNNTAYSRFLKSNKEIKDLSKNKLKNPTEILRESNTSTELPSPGLFSPSTASILAKKPSKKKIVSYFDVPHSKNTNDPDIKELLSDEPITKKETENTISPDHKKSKIKHKNTEINSRAGKEIRLKYNLKPVESIYRNSSIFNITKSSSNMQSFFYKKQNDSKPIIELYSDTKDAVKEDSDDEYNAITNKSTRNNFFSHSTPNLVRNKENSVPLTKSNTPKSQNPKVNKVSEISDNFVEKQTVPLTEVDALDETFWAYNKDRNTKFFDSISDLPSQMNETEAEYQKLISALNSPTKHSEIYEKVVRSDNKHITNNKEAQESTPEIDKIIDKGGSILKTFSNFWNSQSPYHISLKYPIKSHEHMFSDSVILINEEEPNTIVAYTLSTKEYDNQIKSIQNNNDTSLNRDHNNDPSIIKENEKNIKKILVQSRGTHIKYQLNETNVKLSCKIFFAEQFDALREYTDSHSMFIQSLSKCSNFESSGGKSGSRFMKSRDNRFLIKEISKPELDAFLKFAPTYFDYMAKAIFEKSPTLLSKIFGIYRVVLHNVSSGKIIKMDMLVMENLFYNRTLNPVFDLKGSMRNRHVTATGKENQVLLDENLLESILKSPLFVRSYSKSLLNRAINNDTQFLSKINVMDYSLLVGVDKEKKELVAGIVDFIRTFTWDKKVENWVKETGILGGGGEKPTIVSPDTYKQRFKLFMNTYFLMVPDKFYGI